jgi:pSer/pThr/pTyr-binding forkhead associated (FHA) protein
MQQANTVVFAAGNAAGAAGAATPDRHAVRARLVDRTNNRPYDLAGTRIKLGRESSNDIVIADINASRRHAEVTLNQQGLWVITDMNSMNGTLVNGISVASQPLYPGDIVTIGKTDLEFTLV